MTQRRLTMTRRVAFLFCCTVLAATSAQAGARRITPMDRFSDEICEASPETVALDPIQKALRDLAAALAASKLPPAALTLDGGAGTLSIYCRQPCLRNCEDRAYTTRFNCIFPCSQRESQCLNDCIQCEREYGYCPRCEGYEDRCRAAWDACAEPCETAYSEQMNACYDACCFDY